MIREHGYMCGHAESNALLNIDYCDTVFVIRIKKDHTMSMSYPCEKCMTVIKSKGAKTLIYSDWDGIIRKIKI